MELLLPVFISMKLPLGKTRGWKQSRKDGSHAWLELHLQKFGMLKVLNAAMLI
jgi:hypothetical protein